MSPHSLGSHVLVVEDDDMTRQGLVLTLGQAGYAVREAADGEQALVALALPPAPSAILLDVAMPVMNGWEFLRAREALPPHLAAVPVILFSAAVEAVPRLRLPRGW
jgi:CheY-like chemotaxis protein